MTRRRDYACGHDYVIELRNGFVGVDDACRGVRTLQAGIMAALVLGELLRLTPIRRLALILFGCAWVFACNILRATALVIVTANSGPDSLARWHDLIGTLAMVAGMSGLLGLAWLWKSDPLPTAARTESSARESSFVRPLMHWSGWSQFSPSLRFGIEATSIN